MNGVNKYYHSHIQHLTEMHFWLDDYNTWGILIIKVIFCTLASLDKKKIHVVVYSNIII